MDASTSKAPHDQNWLKSPVFEPGPDLNVAMPVHNLRHAPPIAGLTGDFDIRFRVPAG
jgi:hypothetical protein